MKKKILNIVLLLIFFVSTTGLPVTVYLCSMNMDTECEIMNKDIMSHCENEKTPANYSYESDAGCCQVKVIDQSIKDSFTTVNSELKTNLSVSQIQLHLTFSDYNNFESIGLFSHLNDPSPPGLISDHLYLNNSILLI